MKRRNTNKAKEVKTLKSSATYGNKLSSAMGNVDAGALEQLRRNEAQAMFLGVTITELPTSLKIIKDSVYIFNFNCDSMYVFNDTNKICRKLPFTFNPHGIKIKDREILVDEKLDIAYFKYVREGLVHIERIDLANATIASKCNLGEYTFPEKIRISNDYIYFTYYDRFYKNKLLLMKKGVE